MKVEQKAAEYLKAQCQKRKEEFVIRMPEVYIADIPQAFIDGYNEGMKQLRAEIEEFKETNHELAELAIERQKEINELEKCRQILSDCTDRQRKEIHELSDCNSRLLSQAAAATKRVLALEKENAEAKEIIKSLIALHYNPVVTKDDLKKQDKILEQAEQFIKEIEK
jgi:predicted RNase H-like nuclease (RuvC/YqgF family)